jgi:hypothetical protein
MPDFQQPIDGKPPDWLVPPAQQIEKDKKEKEPYSPEFTRELTRYQLFIIFITLFKKMLNLFAAQDQSQMTAVQKQQILEGLLLLRKMFQLLGNQDQSHDPEFTHHLAELWHNLLEDCQHIASKDPNTLKIKNFIDKVNTFPPSTDHSLGYYLREYAGKEWLPFPFMDMLQKLHRQYQENPQTSALNEWDTELSTIIRFLDMKVDLD